MELVSEKEFEQRTVEGCPCGHHALSLYYGVRFSCACGQEHDLRPWMEIVCELPRFRFTVTCPYGFHLTVVQGSVDPSEEVRRLQAELGTRLGDRRQGATGIEFQADLLEKRTGRRCTLEETASLMEHQYGLDKLRRDR